MAHSVEIAPAPASEAGALDGFSLTCSECGPIGGSSLLVIAQQWAVEHREYMSR